MLRKFNPHQDVQAISVLRSKEEKTVRRQLVSLYPALNGGILEEIFPKKGGIKLVKCRDNVEMLADAGDHVTFIKFRDESFIPALKLIEKFPSILPIHQRVDQRAISHVLNGAKIMCPGLTSDGAQLQPCNRGDVVAIFAEGIPQAIAIGRMEMSSDEVREKDAGVAIANLHHKDDGLYATVALRHHHKRGGTDFLKEGATSSGA